MEPWVIATGLIFLYLVATVVIGVVAGRRMSSTLEDYLLYGRRAGFVILYLTVVASYHSAFAFLGGPGYFFTHGIGFWVAGAWTVLVGAITYVLGSRIWVLGKNYGYVTPADMFADYYESEAMRILVALVSVAFTIVYIQVQATGLGYILSAASQGRINETLGTLILLMISAGYLIAAGVRAVYWTDAVQGVWMYVAVWVGAILLSVELFGGPLELWQAVMEQRPDLLSLPGPRGTYSPGMWFGFVIVFSFGIVLQPHLFIRYYTAVSANTIKWLGATTPICLMTLYIPAALVGLGGALVIPDLQTPDRVFPELLIAYAPTWLAGAILAGATAAAMSTLDSILHANMTVLTRDVYQRYLVEGKSQEHYIFVGRMIVVALLIVAFILTLWSSATLVDLVQVSSIGALQLLPGLLGICFPSKNLTTRLGVLAGILIGLDISIFTVYVVPHPFAIHGALWGLTANFAATYFVSRMTAPPSVDTRRRIHGMLEEFVHGSGEGRDGKNGRS